MYRIVRLDTSTTPLHRWEEGSKGGIEGKTYPELGSLVTGGSQEDVAVAAVSSAADGVKVPPAQSACQCSPL